MLLSLLANYGMTQRSNPALETATDEDVAGVAGMLQLGASVWEHRILCSVQFLSLSSLRTSAAQLSACSIPLRNSLVLGQ
jgi:hypothetical protein